VKLTRLSCYRFGANEVRLWLSLLDYDLGNLWRRLALPTRVATWSLTSPQQPSFEAAVRGNRGSVWSPHSRAGVRTFRCRERAVVTLSNIVDSDLECGPRDFVK
jgi:hypothetical protein